jgi:hypothetical protein
MEHPRRGKADRRSPLNAPHDDAPPRRESRTGASATA